MNLTDPKIRSQIMREMGRSGGLKGGRERALRLTPERRSEIARAAAQARWCTREPRDNRFLST
jgi:hypothetical protein